MLYVYTYCHRSSVAVPSRTRPEPPLQGVTCAMTSQEGEIPHGRRAGHATWEQPRTTSPGPPILRQDY